MIAVLVVLICMPCVFRFGAVFLLAQKGMLDPSRAGAQRAQTDQERPLDGIAAYCLPRPCMKQYMFGHVRDPSIA